MNATLLLIFKTALFLVGFIIIISLLQFFINIHPPRFYDKDIPSNYGLDYEKISFKTSDDIQIKGWFITSKESNGTVIVGHGYPFDKGNILPVVKFLYPEYNVLLYDHRYFGESSGWITTAGMNEVKDVEAAVAFVKEKYEDKPIALYGFSLSAASMLMVDVEVNAIVSDSSYADLENMVRHIYKIFGPLKYPFVKMTNIYARIFFGVHPREISPALAIKNKNIPILVIHGEKDSQIPVENVHLLKESNPSIELWIVESANHGQAYALYKEEYKKRVKDFLRKNMG